MLIPFVLPVVMSFIRRFSGRGMIFPVLLFSFAILREGRQAKKQHNCDHQEIFHTFSLPSRNGSYGCKADWQDWWDRRGETDCLSIGSGLQSILSVRRRYRSNMAAFQGLKSP